MDVLRSKPCRPQACSLQRRPPALLDASSPAALPTAIGREPRKPAKNRTSRRSRSAARRSPPGAACLQNACSSRGCRRDGLPALRQRSPRESKARPDWPQACGRQQPDGLPASLRRHRASRISRHFVRAILHAAQHFAQAL